MKNEAGDVHKPLLRKGEDGTTSKADQKSDLKKPESVSEVAGNFLELFPRWGRIASPFFCKSEIRFKAWCLVVSTIILVLFQVAIVVGFSYAQRDFNTALQKKDKESFYASIMRFLLLIIIACPLFTTATFFEGYVSLIWREWLTNFYLKLYYKKKNYYHLKNHVEIDNPDQRITEDVKNFVTTSVKIITMLVKAITYICAFTGVLLSISYVLVVFLLLYSTVGTVIAVAGFGKRLMELQRTALAREATFRFSLVRVREHAESVAFYNGGEREQGSSDGLFANLVVTLLSQLKWLAGLQLFNSCFQYITFILPPLLIAPLYFDGTVEFGVIPQAGMAFSTIRHHLSLLANNLAQFASLGAEAARLTNLRDCLNESPVPPGEVILRKQLKTPAIDLKSNENSNAGTPGGIVSKFAGVVPLLTVESLTLRTPDGRRELVNELSLALKPGESLLIIGPSGCGKSSLLRCFAGLWGRGSGDISMIGNSRHLGKKPENDDVTAANENETAMQELLRNGGEEVAFVPQKPYMALFGSLREQLMFPVPVAPPPTADALGDDPMCPSRMGSQEERGISIGNNADYSSFSKNSFQNLPVQSFRDALDQAALGELMVRFQLDDKIAWEDVLSLGQQQRLTLARLFLKSNIKLAFLDEATSACDSETEQKVYEAVRSHVPTYISIAHRVRSLVKFHTHVLACEPGPDGKNNWVFMTSEQFMKKQKDRGNEDFA